MKITIKLTAIACMLITKLCMVITRFVMMITGICMMKTDVWMRIYHKITLIYLSKYHDSCCIHEENRYKYYDNRNLYDDNQDL